MKYIWLISENLSNTANNNSFWFWKYIVNNFNDLEVFFILSKTDDNKKIYGTFNGVEKEHIIWRNSLEHIKYFYAADMYFVTLSFRDIQPDKILMKSFKPLTTKPLIYLQHGTLGIKRLGYGNMYSNNCMFRFVYYNPKITEGLKQYNDFKNYQMYFGIHHPRYMELAKRHLSRKIKTQKSILWFFTWREYFGKNVATKKFLKNIVSVLNDSQLIEYLAKNNSKIRILLHDKFSVEQKNMVSSALAYVNNVEIVSPSEVDVMQELVDADVLITDYSSVGFDFTLLGKPVILYQYDRKEYLSKRELYCTYAELEQASICKKKDLVNLLVNENYTINKFFTERTSEERDLQKIAEGYYIERMYNYFWNMQRKTIAFLGYDFSGIGGTVFATRALAEGLLEKGYLVRFITLKRVTGYLYPPGVATLPIYNRYKPKLSDKILVSLFRLPIHYSYLKKDPALKSLQPLAGLGMKYLLKHIHAHTVVSTRESLHLFLNDAQSPFIKNKCYFFHTASSLVDKLYPGVIAELQKRGIENALFVTEKNKMMLADKQKFDNYQQSYVIGNTLDSSRMLEREELELPCFNGIYQCAYLLRVSSERQQDLIRLIEFACYLRDNNIENIIIDIYGDGDKVDWLIDEIIEKNLDDYLNYQGKTNDVKTVYKNHICTVDFSYSQSFGMTYIESILNGRMVYCFKNEGSLEVLKDIKGCIVESFDELVKKIISTKDIDINDILVKYDFICLQYSRTAIAEKFLKSIM